MIHQGEVYNYQGGRIVVLSNDRVNEETYPLVGRLYGRSGDEPPYLIGTGEMDPISGAINIAMLAFADPSKLTTPVCQLTGATIARLVEAVRDLFEPE